MPQFARKKRLAIFAVLPVFLFSSLVFGIPSPRDANATNQVTVLSDNNTSPDVTATAQDGSVLLEWPAVVSAQKYRYRYHTGDGNWNNYTFITANGNMSIEVSGLQNDVEHTFAVGARRNDKWRNEWTFIAMTPTAVQVEPELCLDETALNTGGELPCVYEPELCEDEEALNTGGELPCEYEAPEPVEFVAQDYAFELGISVSNAIPSNPSNDRVTSFGKTCIADVNQDGLSDMVWSLHKGHKQDIYLGDTDGTFERSTYYNQFWKKNDSHGCVVADFDGDGLNDIFVPIGACQGTCSKRDSLYMQKNNGSFADQSFKTGPFTKDRSRSAVSADFNNDGLLDIFVSAGSSTIDSDHRLLINQGTANNSSYWQGFEIDPYAFEKNIGNSTCAEAADLDNNGWVDIAVCQEDGLYVYMNNNGVFTPTVLPFSVSEVNGVSLSDVNQDGSADLLLAADSYFEVRLNDGFGDFSQLVWQADAIKGWDIVTPDIDGDGDLDVFALQALGNEDENSLGANALYLNDGNEQFQRVNVPQPHSGEGDKVTVIPNLLNSGMDGVVIGNGGEWDVKGPRQAIGVAGLTPIN